MESDLAHIVERLSTRIAARATADPRSSYTAHLLQGPKEAVLRKVGEEALEVILAAQSSDRDALLGELADLWYPALFSPHLFALAPALLFSFLVIRYPFCPSSFLPAPSVVIRPSGCFHEFLKAVIMY